MSQDAKIITGIGVVTLLIIIIGAIFLSNGSSSTGGTGSASQMLDTTKTDISKLDPSGSFATGPKNAPVTLVEFGDFECPACGAMYPVVKQIQQKYGKKLNFVFRNFPLPASMHPNAMIAAQAAVAASEQGKFWQMHDALYDNQSTWGDSKDPKSYFDTYAKQIGLNVSKFDQDLQSKTVISKVQSDAADGNSLGINETPTFYINQLKFSDQHYNITDMETAIDSQLKK